MEYINENYEEPDYSDGQSTKELYGDFDAYMKTRFIAVPFSHVCNVPLEPGWDSHPSMQRVQTIEPDHAMQPAKLFEPEDALESFNLIEPDYAMRPDQSIDPIEPDYDVLVQLIERDNALQPVQLIQLNHAMQPAELVDTVQSVESSHIIQPIQPVEPVEQSQPSHQTDEQKQLSQCNVEIGQKPVQKYESYPSNIMMAINSSGKEWLRVEEIYDFFYKIHPEYRNLDKKEANKWKSSVRHALSASGKFVQYEVPATSDRVKQKRFEYAINPDLDKGKKERKQKKAMPATEYEF